MSVINFTCAVHQLWPASAAVSSIASAPLYLPSQPTSGASCPPSPAHIDTAHVHTHYSHVYTYSHSHNADLERRLVRSDAGQKGGGADVRQDAVGARTRASTGCRHCVGNKRSAHCGSQATSRAKHGLNINTIHHIHVMKYLSRICNSPHIQDRVSYLITWHRQCSGWWNDHNIIRLLTLSIIQLTAPFITWFMCFL